MSDPSAGGARSGEGPKVSALGAAGTAGAGAGPGGLFASVQRLLATLIALLHNRADLLATELAEERERLLAVLAWGATALLMLMFGSVFLALLVAVLLWDSHRLLALAGIALFFLGGGCWALRQARSRLHAQGGLFSASLAELARDRDALSGAGGGQQS